MPPAMKWADEALKNRPAGSRAEFYRTLPEGSTYKGEGSPWTEPFHVHEINEYGVIHMGALRAGRSPEKLNAKKIKEALSYVHHWSARERGKDKKGIAQAAKEAISGFALNEAEAKILLNAIHVKPSEIGRDPGYRTVGSSVLSTFGKGKLKRQIGVIGNAIWRLPSPSPYVIYWNGRGARLLFGTNKPGSQLSPINHPSASENYRSLKEAQAAVTRFWKS
jgi:hypothetical protein